MSSANTPDIQAGFWEDPPSIVDFSEMHMQFCPSRTSTPVPWDLNETLRATGRPCSPPEWNTSSSEESVSPRSPSFSQDKDSENEKDWTGYIFQSQEYNVWMTPPAAPHSGEGSQADSGHFLLHEAFVDEPSHSLHLEKTGETTQDEDPLASAHSGSTTMFSSARGAHFESQVIEQSFENLSDDMPATPLPNKTFDESRSQEFNEEFNRWFTPPASPNSGSDSEVD